MCVLLYCMTEEFKMYLKVELLIWHYKAHLFLKGSSDAHFPQVDMIIYGLNEKSITHFG